MTNQNVVIGIAVGMFLAGLAFGYITFMSTTHSGNMMNNQQTMMANSGFMEYNDELMHEMMQNYDNREHMMGHMIEDRELLENMGLESMIQSGSMGQNMMGMMSPEVMNMIMEDPQKRDQMMSMMKEHVSDMDELLSSNLTDQEFSEKMSQLMHGHMSEMQGLMQMP